MATRIVVIKDGFIQQVASPQVLYDNPCNLFVATFIGSPQMNIFEATVIDKDGVTYLEFGEKSKIRLPDEKGRNPEVLPMRISSLSASVESRRHRIWPENH